MIVLALDTCGDACAAAVVRDRETLAARSLEMQRGHQEALGPLVEQVMRQSAIAFEALDRIGVTVGPGSFTGLRIGLAFAKGLAFARGLPLAGIGVLPALAASAGGGKAAGVVDARRDEVYFQAFEDGRPAGEAQVLTIQAARQAAQDDWTLVGSGAALLGRGRVLPLAAPDPVRIAQLAARARAPLAAARPIYIRPPYAGWPPA